MYLTKEELNLDGEGDGAWMNLSRKEKEDKKEKEAQQRQKKTAKNVVGVLGKGTREAFNKSLDKKDALFGGRRKTKKRKTKRRKRKTKRRKRKTKRKTKRRKKKRK